MSGTQISELFDTNTPRPSTLPKSLAFTDSFLPSTSSKLPFSVFQRDRNPNHEEDLGFDHLFKSSRYSESEDDDIHSSRSPHTEAVQQATFHAHNSHNIQGDNPLYNVNTYGSSTGMGYGHYDNYSCAKRGPVTTERPTTVSGRDMGKARNCNPLCQTGTGARPSHKPNRDTTSTATRMKSRQATNTSRMPVIPNHDQTPPRQPIVPPQAIQPQPTYINYDGFDSDTGEPLPEHKGRGPSRGTVQPPATQRTNSEHCAKSSARSSPVTSGGNSGSDDLQLSLNKREASNRPNNDIIATRTTTRHAANIHPTASRPATPNGQTSQGVHTGRLPAPKSNKPTTVRTARTGPPQAVNGDLEKPLPPDPFSERPVTEILYSFHDDSTGAAAQSPFTRTPRQKSQDPKDRYHCHICTPKTFDELLLRLSVDPTQANSQLCPLNVKCPKYEDACVNVPISVERDQILQLEVSRNDDHRRIDDILSRLEGVNLRRMRVVQLKITFNVSGYTPAELHFGVNEEVQQSLRSNLRRYLKGIHYNWIQQHGFPKLSTLLKMPAQGFSGKRLYKLNVERLPVSLEVCIDTNFMDKMSTK
ncbi:hypothetical protein CVT24_000212 [Panaeolus cyanescens]|uniref:Uncharacterized protein n=1 Tax=Panaeolus cyanescens TaxID=181874 RepID=A0A409VIQ1_9AGAR|nr:hypothetical protein CVT24_000212 [Panaeolus cyanescens]